ncbi:glycerate kinase [uncultured Sulfitobacter sp.]|jgi:glycerate 2-kinase|uniref:glycerate kinase type-2 family protein n=1 Tax=uncultured Sulfitobacter sp. TaxID=191468 RepID=UPI0030F8511C
MGELSPMEEIANPRAFLEQLFQTAVSAADPKKILSGHIPRPVKGRTVVVGAGKASAALAAAFEQEWIAAGHGALEGLVVTQYGYAAHCDHIAIVETRHPVPDENGLQAGRRVYELAKSLGPDDQLVALISGGGSSLLTLPPDEIGLATKQYINRELLKSGASIGEMNCIRKHFSQIKGGRLTVAAWPAKVRSLVLSDVPGDELYQVASGPTIPDPSDQKEALRIIERYDIDLPQSAKDWIQAQKCVAPTPEIAEFKNAEVILIGSAQTSLKAAADRAAALGVTAHILSDSMEGEAREIAKAHVGIINQINKHAQPFTPPCVLLSGGETTVTLRQKGKGGRNTEFLLSLAQGIQGQKDIHALAADTDGIDGSQDNAGAFCDGTTIYRIQSAGVDPENALANNDAWTAFSASGDLFVTGPTQTNVNDFRAILIATSPG